MNAKQLELRPVDLPHFDGEPEPAEGANRVRLSRQLHAVYDLMRDGQPRTLEEIANRVGCSQPSASARLRDLRKERIMGGRGVCTVYRTNAVKQNGAVIRGLYLYSVKQGGQP